MPNLTETSTWEAGIRRFDTTDLVLGGDDTQPDNVPLRQLANRTVYLRDTVAIASALTFVALESTTL